MIVGRPRYPGSAGDPRSRRLADIALPTYIKKTVVTAALLSTKSVGGIDNPLGPGIGRGVATRRDFCDAATAHRPGDAFGLSTISAQASAIPAGLPRRIRAGGTAGRGLRDQRH